MLRRLALQPRATARAAPDALFREWQAGVAAARRGDGSAAGADGRSSPSPEAGPRPASGSGPSSAPAPDPPSAPTGTFALAAPRAHPLYPAAAGPELDAQVDELIQRDPAGAEAMALAVFRRLPTAQLGAEVERRYPSAPMPSHATEGDPGARSPAARSPPAGLALETRRPHALVVTQRVRCFCCDELVGDGQQPCRALELLDSLSHFMDERDDIIEREVETGSERHTLHRQARWFMYREYVAAHWGHLGRGVRVCLPDCVVAAIRSRYRASGCECQLAQLAGCSSHGYVGFRDVH